MNKRLIWFSELFLWIAFAIIAVMGFSYAFFTAEKKNHGYYLFFDDVDGLSKGSPVRLMGLNIGFVRDVKVFRDKIFVSFLVTEKNVFIPSGSEASVAFYGLGGSKSLEIIPPCVKNDNFGKGEIILTKNPYRIADYYNWSSQINRTIELMATKLSENIDAYLPDGINSPFLYKNIHKFNNMLQSFIKSEDNVILNFSQKINNFNLKHKNIGVTQQSETSDKNNNCNILNKENKHDLDNDK